MEQREDLIKQYVLAFDPSGAFENGKGTTGWCVQNCQNFKIVQIGVIKATDYSTKYEYWDAHIQLIRKMLKQYENNLAISIEDYILYANQAEAQINSTFETVRLIAIMEQFCWSNGLIFKLRLATAAKTRWTNEILVHKDIIEIAMSGFFVPCTPDHFLATHELDAVRHATHYSAFENKCKEALFNEQDRGHRHS